MQHVIFQIRFTAIRSSVLGARCSELRLLDHDVAPFGANMPLAHGNGGHEVSRAGCTAVRLDAQLDVAAQRLHARLGSRVISRRPEY